MPLRSLMLLAALVVSAPLVAGYFGWLHPALDSFSHFRLHLGVLLALVGVAMLLCQRWLKGLLALLLAAGSVAGTYGRWEFPARAEAGQTNGPTYRLLQLNVHPRNRTPEAVIALIGRISPDIVVLQETSGLLGKQPEWLDNAFPHSFVCGSPRPHIAIFSRHPLEPTPRPACFQSALATATVNLDGRFVGLGSIHLAWPWPRRQAAQIEAMRPNLATIGETAILAGDMNAAPWSHAARQVSAHAGMTRMENIGGTWIFRVWPRQLARFGLPIDHVMSKGGVVVHDVRRLESVGSDHLPLLIEFSLSEPDRQHPSMGRI